MALVFLFLFAVHGGGKGDDDLGGFVGLAEYGIRQHHRTADALFAVKNNKKAKYLQKTAKSA